MTCASKELWTNSRATAFLRCQREHKFKYVQGYEPVSSRSALQFGTLIHVGLEHWWKAPSSTRLESSISAFRAALPPGFDSYDAARGEAMLIGYDARWGEADFETVAVELEFRAPMVDPVSGDVSELFDNAGKVDVIAFDRARGRLVGIEHKTTGIDAGAGADYWQTLRVDGQSTKYFDGAQSHGFEIVEMIYDMLVKPKIKPLKATPPAERKYTKEKIKGGVVVEPSRLYATQHECDETPGEYFTRCMNSIADDPNGYYVRVPIVRLEHERIDARAEQFALAEFSVEAARAGFAPRNPGACRRYNSLCPYLPVCSGEGSLQDERLYTLSATKHSELSQEVQQ